MRKSVPAVALCLVAAVVMAANALGQEAVLLRLNLRAGSQRLLRMTSDQTMTQTNPTTNAKQTVRQKTETEFLYEVTGVDAAGNATIKATFKSIRFWQQNPMGTTEYDSAKPAETLAPMAKPMAALVGMSFQMTMTPQGRVTGVQGMGALIKKMVDAMELPEGANADAFRKAVEGQFSDQSMMEMMEKSMFVYSDKPVALGDSWQATALIKSVMPMVIENTLTLKDRKKGIAFLAVRSSVKPNPEGPPVVMGGMKIRYSISGEQTGTQEVDEATGWAIRSKVTHKLTGAMIIESEAGAGAPMTIPTTTEGTVSVESTEPK